MKTRIHSTGRSGISPVPLSFSLSLLLGALFGLLHTAQAFPPAPHHLFFGMVRDEYGTPVDVAGAQVILVSANGKQLKTLINSKLQPGVNYKLEVPMDAGLTSDLYRPTAMHPTMPFQIKVVINGRTNLPIELKGEFGLLGKAGKQTLMNLTLGVDADGDGLPDAWERLINADISKVGPGDMRGNGLTVLQEYLAGIYPLDDRDGFRLTLSGNDQGEPMMNFVAVQGRSYTLFGSADLTAWTALRFRIPAVDTDGAEARSFYQARDFGLVEIKASIIGTDPVPAFFKLMVQ